MSVPLQVARLVLVVALLGVAAYLATPKGRLPLALRGLRRVLSADAALKPEKGAPALLGARILALVLVGVAIALVML